MKAKTIKQTVSFKCSPHDFYEAIMDSKKHGEFTGDKASVSRKEGGKFSIFGGYATGKNLELVADKKIVQSWRSSDWKEEDDSIVTFSIEKTKTGCKLSFTHEGIPAEHFDGIKQGWKDYYWTPMKEMLEK